MTFQNTLWIVSFLLLVGLPLPFLSHAWTLYNVMNSFDDVAVTRSPEYFYGLFLGINIVAIAYSCIVAKLINRARAIAMMSMLIGSGIILIIGIVMMTEYSDQMPFAGIALLTGSFTPVVIFVAMETCFVFFPNVTTVPVAVYSQFPGLLLSIYNTYGVPISATSMYTHTIDTFQTESLIATIQVCTAICVYYVHGYQKSKPTPVDQKGAILTFKELKHSLLTDSTHIFVIIMMMFPVVGQTVNFGPITSGLTGHELDSALVKDIAITGYIESTVVSQLVVLFLSFIPVVRILSTSNRTHEKYERTDWFMMNMMVWVLCISLITTMICVGIGSEASLRVQSYIDSALPISFFGVAYARYATRNSMTNTPIIFAFGLVIASSMTFINVPIENAGLYMDPIAARCLIIIPSFISLMMVIHRVYTDSHKAKQVDITPPVDGYELTTEGQNPATDNADVIGDTQLVSGVTQLVSEV